MAGWQTLIIQGMSAGLAINWVTIQSECVKKTGEINLLEDICILIMKSI